MKYKDKEYVFSKDYITNIWIALNSESALNNNKEIIVKVKEKRKIDKTFPARNKITCALEQIENVLDYLNYDYELKPTHNQRNAFDFVEFLNCEYIVVHSIDTLQRYLKYQQKILLIIEIVFRVLHTEMEMMEKCLSISDPYVQYIQLTQVCIQQYIKRESLIVVQE